MRRRRQHVATALIAAFAVLFTGVTVGRLSSAAFSARTTTPPGGWGSGTVSVSNSANGAAVFDAATSGLLDGGQTQVKCITVTYTGTITQNVAINTYANANGGLGPFLDLTVEEGTASTPGSCAGFTPSGGALYSGTLAGYATANGTPSTGVSSWAPTAQGEKRTFRFTTTVQNIPAAQDQNVTATFTWFARTVQPLTYPEQVMSDRPMAFWRFGEHSGSSIADTSGNARTATLNGPFTRGAPPLIKSSVDPSLALASGAYADAPTVPDTSAITVEAVIRPTGTWSTNGNIANKDNGWDARGYMFFRAPSGQIAFFYQRATGGYSSIASLAKAPLNVTTHVAVTLDGTAVALYINGVKDAAAGGGGAIKAMPGMATRIGGTQDVNNPAWFTGTIDELAIYGSALSPQRVAAHAAAAL